jgi:sigma-E factor negative regulatory protein RseB
MKTCPAAIAVHLGRWLAAVAGGAMLVPILAAADRQGNDPRQLLERMERAVETLNYEGTFVHIVEGRADTMYVVHRVENGKTTERLISLDGPGREIIRDENEVTCIFGDRQSVLVERRSGGGPLREALPRYSRELDQYYEFASLRPEKKMGRSAEVIAIRPRDDFRYGYKLWMDTATGMLLKAQLVDVYGEIVEQLLFVSIELPDQIPDAKLEPTLSTEGFTWYVQDERSRAEEQTGSSNWRAAETPAGFELEAANIKVMAGSERAVEHLVYTDGVASVSVFVEPSGASKEGMAETSRIGAANAFTAVVEGHQVTAVGEVPINTVRMIARSMQRQSAAVASQ